MTNVSELASSIPDTVFTTMPTRRFSDITVGEQVGVVDAFLGSNGPMSFTEKLAGQHFSAVVKPDGSVNYHVKSSTRAGAKGIFPAVESALESRHPPVDRSVVYQFEVVKKRGRPDFIAYLIDANFVAVELSGAMNQAVADALNSGQGEVAFYTKSKIEKRTDGVVQDQETRRALEDFRSKATRGSVSRSDSVGIENILMDLVDSGKFPSSLGGSRIEGLFGFAASGGFKIPSRAYSDLQRKQAKFYAIAKSGGVRQAINRFEAAVGDPSADRLVSDVLDYVDYASSSSPGNGFRVFFSKQEATDLASLASSYRGGNSRAGTALAKKFFSRVNDKESWVTVEAVERWKLLAGIG